MIWTALNLSKVIYLSMDSSFQNRREHVCILGQPCHVLSPDVIDCQRAFPSLDLIMDVERPCMIARWSSGYPSSGEPGRSAGISRYRARTPSFGHQVAGSTSKILWSARRESVKPKLMPKNQPYMCNAEIYTRSYPEHRLRFM